MNLRPHGYDGGGCALTRELCGHAPESIPAMLRDGVDHAMLDAKYAALQSAGANFLGYPVNLHHDCSDIARFLEFSLNNMGDPFQHSPIQLNTLEFEREVIECFEWLTGGDPEDTWGYVTGGGTEGNMYGLYLARELLPEGIVYFSEETHYSVMKVLRLQHMPNIMLKSQPNGELDYEDLEASLRINRHRPPRPINPHRLHGPCHPENHPSLCQRIRRGHDSHPTP